MKSIFIIDDDPDILEALHTMVSMEGYAVTTSLKEDAIQNINGHPAPHLIILDVLLSGNDGRLICKQLRQQKKTKHVPVIMISAHPDAERSALEAGADDFLAKPFEIGDLLKRVRALLE